MSHARRLVPSSESQAVSEKNCSSKGIALGRDKGNTYMYFPKKATFLIVQSLSVFPKKQ
jgi:hypothetical protein